MIIGGLLILVLLFVGAVFSGMLREAGPGTAHSLGKSQMAFWGLLVVLSFFCIWFISGKMEYIPDKVLILIGISGTTGLASILIGDSKKSSAAQKADDLGKENDKDAVRLAELEADKKRLDDEKNAGGVAWSADKEKELATVIAELANHQKALESSKTKLDSLQKEAEAPDTDAWFTDIISDANGPSFPRVQMLLWTFVLGCVFVRSVGTVFSMPEFDNTLLLLMGISNSTYLGFKMPEKS